MKNSIRVKINRKEFRLPRGTLVGEALKKARGKNVLPYLGAILHNRLVDPDYSLTHDCALEAVTYHDWEGLAIYRRSATLILIEAVHQLFPGKRLVIGQSIAHGYYFDLYLNRTLSPVDIGKIEKKMHEITEEDLLFKKRYFPFREAKTYFEKHHLRDKVKLLDYLRSPEIRLVSCGDFHELYFGPLAPSTGQIEVFALQPYQEGLVLRFPAWERGRGWRLSPVSREPKLFNSYRETREWNKILAVENVGQLNEMCVSGKVRELIIIAEALHEKKIAAIADEIARRADQLKLVLIAGPSASGKTTFAQRLIIELRVNGLDPVALSIDNYFRDRGATPRDETGRHDFEALEAINLELFNLHLKQLITGKLVKTPVFDFKKGIRKKKIHRPLKLTRKRILIVEGLHALNDRVSEGLPEEIKFRIYVSALTQLCVDDHNRIFTSDTRLIRRIVRDRSFRGWSAAESIKRWPSVRQGENLYIFPYQENADVMFNSALVYEHAVLKYFTEQALLEVTPDQPEYVEADRLLHFIYLFVPISERDVPSTSILREFIGDSFFQY